MFAYRIGHNVPGNGVEGVDKINGNDASLLVLCEVIVQTPYERLNSSFGADAELTFEKSTFCVDCCEGPACREACEDLSTRNTTNFFDYCFR